MTIDTLLDDTGALQSRAALRTRMSEQGVVYLPGLLDSAHVEKVGAAAGECLATHGWVTDPRSLHATGEVRMPGQAGFGRVYAALQSLESIHRLAFEPALVDTVGLLFDEPVFAHPGKVVRVAPPDPDGVLRTRPHQDFSLLQTTADTVTAWMPLVECTLERGPLMVRPGSHHGGFRRPSGQVVDGEYDIFLPVGDEEPGWASAHFRPGDVVLVHGLTVHAALPNRSDACRLSIDARFQSVADPLMWGTTRPNRASELPPWDVLTAEWGSREWVTVPDPVTVHRPPEGSTLAELFDTLVVPPSRFVAS